MKNCPEHQVTIRGDFTHHRGCKQSRSYFNATSITVGKNAKNISIEMEIEGEEPAPEGSWNFVYVQNIESTEGYIPKLGAIRHPSKNVIVSLNGIDCLTIQPGAGVALPLAEGVKLSFKSEINIEILFYGVSRG